MLSQFSCGLPPAKLTPAETDLQESFTANVMPVRL